MGEHCHKCGREVNGFRDTCDEDVCPMVLPGSGTNSRELTWAKHTSLRDAREREALKTSDSARGGE